MMLSVVIPTLFEEENVAACIESARGLAAGWGGAIEVIVADGGSRDGTVENARAAGAIVVSTKQGRGQQLREGVSRSKGDIVLMLHADTLLSVEAGEQLATALRDPLVGCGAFKQCIEAVGVRYRLLEWGNAWRARRAGLPYGDQGIFARRPLIDSVGGIPAIPLMEDVQLMLKLRRQSWPVLLPGPLAVSARRWQRSGVVRQTIKNWSLLAAYRLGVSPERLAHWYRGSKSEVTT